MGEIVIELCLATWTFEYLG